jgi:HSP20 family protein
MNTTLSKWNPFNDLSDLQKRLSSILSSSDLGGAESSDGHTSLMNADWQPAVDISEDDKEYLVTADLPEVKKEEVQIGVENGVLTITGERKSEVDEKDEKKKYHRIERRYGRYVRTFRLPEDVDEEKIAADFENGVLRVHLPKGAQTASRKIKVG